MMPGQPMADDGGQLDLVLSAPFDKFLQHFSQALDGAFAVRILIAVPPSSEVTIAALARSVDFFRFN